MRLTLRTLLAYLDDALEPVQAKEIGQKIAESEPAKELIARIKEVTRRRRLAAPPDAGPSSIDANTIAEYLDNIVSAEKAAEIEQICLDSDLHLAEVAGCHQILALVLGEPLSAPPPAKKRMYGLVHGREANPRRKPPGPPSDHAGAVDDEADEALRLGMPLLTRGTRSRKILLAGGGVLLTCLLIFALWQVLTPLREPEPRGPVFAQGDDKDKKIDVADPSKKEPPAKVEPKIEEKQPPEKIEPEPKVQDPSSKEPDKKTPELPKEIGKLPDLPAEVPYAPPDNRSVVVGEFQVDLKAPTILFQTPVGKAEWARASLKNPQISSGRTLVSLPGSRSAVQLNSGILLTLWGHLPELWPTLPVLESLVDLHAHDKLDLDLSLRRGRIVIASLKDKPSQVRIRFENPTQPEQLDYIDLVLEPKAEALVDRLSFYPPNEPFFKNPKDPNRQGPVSAMGFWVLKGSMLIDFHDLSYGMDAPPGKALILWSSREKLGAPQMVKTLPEGIAQFPAQAPGVDPKARAAAASAVKQLDLTLSIKSWDVGLEEMKNSDDAAVRMLAVRCYGAIDELRSLADGLANEKHSDVRRTAALTAQSWTACGRDHDYKLWDALKQRFRGIEAEKIMELMHGFTDVGLLLDYLNNPVVTIRELAALNLYRMVPQGQSIPYEASMDAGLREQAQRLWSDLLRKLIEGMKGGMK